MHKDLIRKELKDIQAKKEELRNNIETMKTKEEVEKYDKEIRSIVEKENKLQDELDEIVRNDEGDAILPETKLTDEQIRSLKPIYTAGEEQQMKKRYDRNVIERAWALKVLQRENEMVAEERAALESLITTTKTFTPATSTTVGQSNAGVLIPTSIMIDILNEVKNESPLLKDISIKHLKGIARYPYKKESKGGKFEEENKEGKNKNESYEINFDFLDLIPIRLAVTATMTMEMLNMTPEEFVAYIKEEIILDLTDKLINGVIYGSGKDQFKGIIPEATLKVENEADIYLAIKKGLNLVPKNRKQNSKVYISEEMANELFFTEDTNKRPKVNPINSLGLKQIATKQIEIDPYLKANDIIIGNAKDYILNNSLDFEMGEERYFSKGVVDYTAAGMFAGAPIPGKFVYIKVPNA